MKTLIVAVAVALLAPLAHAWEVEGNPDSRPSVFLGYKTGSLDGDLTAKAAGFSDSKYAVDVDRNILELSLRLPLHRNLTLDLGVEDVNDKQNITSATTSQPMDVDGKFYSIGARFYLPK